MQALQVCNMKEDYTNKGKGRLDHPYSAITKDKILLSFPNVETILQLFFF
jgi:hypothetical protein